MVEVVFAGEAGFGEVMSRGFDARGGGHARLTRRDDVLERLQGEFEGEFDEGGGVAGFVALAEDGVVIGLAVADDGFDGDLGKEGMMSLEDEAVPEAAHASVSVFKGMDELHLVVADDRADGRGHLGVGVDPFEQGFHQSGHASSGRGDVGDLIALGDADAFAAPGSGLLDQSGHHDLVRGEQVFGVSRSPFRQLLVASDGVAHFAEVAFRRGDAPAFENGSHLLLREGVSLDLQARLDGAHTQRASQHRAHRRPQRPLMTPDPPLDFREQPGRKWSDFKRRSHAVIVSNEISVAITDKIQTSATCRPQY